MRELLRWVLLLLCFAVLMSEVAAAPPSWRSLFNGKDLSGWRPVGAAKWSVVDGAIVGDNSHGFEDWSWLVSEAEFGDFVLRLRFRWVSGNSGVQFRSRLDGERMSGYQADVYPGRAGVTGTLYEMNGRGGLKAASPAAERALDKTGWNDYEIVATGDHIAFWLNGAKVLDVRDDRAARGVVGFQLHKSQACRLLWKDIRILELKSPADFQPLFNGKDLSGWKPLGDAKWSVEQEVIRGLTGRGGYGWLVSDREFANFVLRLRFRWYAGNSGVQFRSKVHGTMVHGYQADIDLGGNVYTGMLYDEGFRGKLVAPPPDFLKSVKRDGWNDYEISAIGDHILMAINGVKSVDFYDPLLSPRLPPARRDPHHAKGILALQVHSGRNVKLEWKDLRILDLGESGSP